jgi:hypothetical protein
MRLYAAYAPPSMWGTWTNIANYAGVVTYSITASPDGSTVLKCQVRYYAAGDTPGNPTVSDWNDSTTVTTGDAIGTLDVRFQGVPTGSSVSGTITP